MTTNLLNVVIIFTTVKILSDLMATWLGANKQKRFESFLERWKNNLGQISPDRLFEIPLTALANAYEGVLGPNPFSWKAFRRTCIFGFLFLGASLGITGLLCGRPFAMNLLPWDSFFASTEYLKVFANNMKLKHEIGDAFFVLQNASDLSRLNSWPFAVAFTLYFALVVATSASFLFSVSVGVSRLFLKEMILARTSFRVFLLFLSNAVLLFGFGAAASLGLFVLLNVWTWPFLPLLLALSKLSLAGGVGLTSWASWASWFFSAPWLRVVVVLSLSPFILAVFVIGVTMIAFPFRGNFRSLATKMLALSLQSPKGVFSFLSSTSAALAFLLTSSASILACLARISLAQSIPNPLGVDSLALSFVVFTVMLFLSLARAQSRRISVPGTLPLSDVLFLFFGGTFVIILGFYI